MSRRAWFYIVCVLVTGAVLGLLSFVAVPLDPTQQLTFVVLLLLATPAQLYMVRVPGHQSYHANVLVFFGAVLLLQPPLYVLLVIVPHLLEWAKERLTHSPRLRDWYLQPFNMAMHIAAGTAARWVYSALDPSGDILLVPVGVLGASVAALTYVAVNHLVVGQALVLARRISWSESGVLDTANLITDAVLLLLGYTVAALWRIHPWLIIPAVSPVILIYRAIMVPQLMKEAQTDEKTGLYSSRHFMRVFTTEVERAKRFGRPLAVIMADLDLLRNINNTYGHIAGDCVLAGVGQLLRSSIRSYDTAGRFGGEEFCIVLPESGPAEAREVAERIRQATANAAFETKTTTAPIHATMSLGVAYYPSDATTPVDLIHQADLAVYQAKLKGRNRVETAADVPHSVRLAKAPADAHQAPVGAVAYVPRPTEEVAEQTDAGAAPSAEPPTSELPTPGRLVAKQSYPASFLWVFIIETFIGAAVVTAMGLSLGGFPDLGMLWPLVILAVISQIPQAKNLYGESSISVSSAVVFAAGLTSGVVGVAIVSAAVVIAHRVQIHPLLVKATIYKTAFNWATHVIAGLAPVAAIRFVGMPFGFDSLPFYAIPTMAAALVYYAVESALVTGYVSLSEGKEPLSTWRERYAWLAVHYVVLCVIGLFLAAALTALGVAGVLIFVLPVMMMVYVQRQYLERSQRGVTELQRLNDELTLANREISKASEAIRVQNEDLFLTLAKIIDTRDPYVLNHAAKVADYAIAIAHEMKLPSERIEHLRQAAFLHDIGKLGVPDAILHKPARLTPEEYACVKTHVDVGAAFLETCQGLRHLASAVNCHHEWWNGSGYPHGLRGEKPPLEARILALSDAVEAMASDRPYHAAMPLDDIIAEVKRCSATQFDPTVVDAFVRVIRQNGTQLVVNSARAPAHTYVRHVTPRQPTAGPTATLRPA